MGRKFIKQKDSLDFVYPNNFTAEYDLEIIHDINDNCVSGVTTVYSATTMSSTGITFNIQGSWSLNGAEPYININGGVLSVASIHLLGPTQSYYRPWRLVHNITSTGTTSSSVSFNENFTVLPSELGLTGFTSGTYYSEIRMIGKKCVYPICYTLELVTPTPTPTPTPVTPTPTPVTVTPTPTPVTVTPTPTPVTPTPTPQCTQLNWSFTETNGAQGTFELYVNSILVESRSSNSSGSYTVCLNDTIEVEVFCNVCESAPSVYSNAYSLSDKFVLTDAACTQNGTASMITGTYTVVSGDIGTPFSVDTHAECASACI
jgi:hypothetical protein